MQTGETPQGARFNDMHTGNDPNYNSTFFNRYSRLEFPRFSGGELRNWLYKVDQFFSMDEIPFKQRVKVASIHL